MIEGYEMSGLPSTTGEHPHETKWEIEDGKIEDIKKMLDLLKADGVDKEIIKVKLISLIENI